MKSKLLNRDYPLSETMMNDNEDKKKVSDVKSSVAVKKPIHTAIKSLEEIKSLDKGISREEEKVFKKIRNEK